MDKPDILPRTVNKENWCSYCKTNNHTDKSCRYLKNKVGSGRNSAERVNELVNTKEVDNTEHSFPFRANSDDEVVFKSDLLVDCGATAHILNDESKFSSFDKTFRSEKHFTELANGERVNAAMKRGNANMKLKDSDGNPVDITITETSHYTEQQV